MTRGGQGRDAKNKMPYQLEMKNVESVGKVDCRIGQENKMPSLQKTNRHIIQVDYAIFYTKHIWYRAPVTPVSS